MTFSYLSRMLCICLASFFLVHLVLGTVVSLLAPAIVRIAERTASRPAASLLLFARFLPSCAALLSVASLCIPSYLALEPRASDEEVGWFCLAAALLAIAICGTSLMKGAMAVVKSSRYVVQCRQSGRDTRLSEEASPALMIDGNSPVLALSGLFQPRLIVSRRVFESLSSEEFQAALLHERAHQVSRDNLKRLGFLAAPGLLPVFHGFHALETAWARMAEWAADDRASAGDPRRSTALAAALLKVARLGAAVQPSPLSTTLLPDHQDLAIRVERLLYALPSTPASHGARLMGPFLLAASALAAAVLSLQPDVLLGAHLLLETLSR